MRARLLLERGFRCAAGALTLAGAGLLTPTAQAQNYTLIDLGTLAPGLATIVRGPNGGGDGVGGGHVPRRGLSGERRGLMFAPGWLPQTVGGLDDTDDTSVFGVNDFGEVVGSSNAATGTRGFVARRGAPARELPPLHGDTGSMAFDVDNGGQAVGYSSGASGQRAVIWSAAGDPTALPGFANSRALSLNQRGDVVGVAGNAGQRKPVVWPRSDAARELPLPVGHTVGEAYGINARGHIVGYSAGKNGLRRAVVWPSADTVVELDTLGGNFSQAFGINDAGDVVGASTVDHASRAVLWDRRGRAHDLNTRIPPSKVMLTKAVGINNRGMILATGHEMPEGHGNHDPAHGHDDLHDLPVRVFLLLRRGGPR